MQIKESQMIDHTFLVKSTPQKEWSQGKGWFLIIAIFLGGLGGGTYLVSTWLSFLPGLLLGWLMVLFGKTTAHLLFLGRPSRFWRAFTRPQTSWISRGIIILTLFLIFSALQLAPSLKILDWLPWTTNNLVLKTITILSGFGLVMYTGFLLRSVKAIAFWNDAFVPVLFTLYSLLGGMGLLMAVHNFIPGGRAYINRLESIAPWMLSLVALVLLVYIYIMYNKTTAARRAVLDIIKGRTSPVFILGVAVLGIAFPLSVAIYSMLDEPSWVILTFGAVCELAGGFCFRYSLLKAGSYEALI